MPPPTPLALMSSRALLPPAARPPCTAAASALQVARELNAGGVGTLLMDLLSEAEAAGPSERQLVFDVPLLASRLRLASTWLLRSSGLGLPPQLPLGFFGASTGGGAALWAAAGACF